MKTLKPLIMVMFVLLVTFLLVHSGDAQSRGGGHSGGYGGGGRGYYGGYAHGYSPGYHGGYGYGWRGYPYRWGYPYWWRYRYWWGYPYGWGSPYWWDYSYYPYNDPYYDPYYYEGSGGPPVPPEGSAPMAESGQQEPAYWHFCQDPEGYYPHVKDCPGGWMTVVPPKPDAAPPSKLGAPVLPTFPPDKKPKS